MTDNILTPKNRTGEGDSILKTHFDILNKGLPNRENISLGQYGVGESQYDTNITPQNLPQLNLIRATKQPWYDQAANMAVQGVTKAALTIPEASSYLLDLGESIAAVKGTERNFTNFIAELTNKAKKNTAEAFPIYEQEPGKFNIDDPGMWFNLGTSAIESAGYLIPGTGLAKGISTLSKAIKLSKKATGIASAVGTAIGMNYAEHMLSAGQHYNDAKQAYIESGKSQEEADALARDEAENIIIKGKANIALEVFEWSNLLRGINETKNIASLSLKNKLKSLSQTAGAEALEEVNTGFIETEAKRKTDINLNKIKDDRSNIVSRYLDYTISDDGLLNAVGGALGGIVMQGSQDIKNLKQDRAFVDNANKVIKETSSTLKDSKTFNAATDDQFANMVLQNIPTSTTDRFKETLKELSKMSADEAIDSGYITKPDEHIDFINSINNKVKDIDFIQDTYNNYQVEHNAPEFIGQIYSKINYQLKQTEEKVSKEINNLNQLYSEYQSTQDNFEIGNLKKLQSKIVALESIKSNLEKDENTKSDKNLNKVYNNVLTDLQDLNKSFDTTLQSIKQNNRYTNEEISNILDSSKDQQIFKGELDLYQYQQAINSLKKNKKDLTTEKGIKETTDKLIKKATENTTFETPIEEPKPTETKETIVNDIPELDYQEFINTGNIKPEHLETIATKIQNTTPLTVKEKAIYSAKSKQVEQILTDRTKTKDTTKTTTIVNIVEDRELQTKNGILFDEDSAKAETPNKTAGQHYIDGKDSVLNPDESQQRWFNYLQNKLDLDIHRLLVVTPENDSSLFNQLVPEDKYKIGSKDFINGIYVVLIDDNNNQIKVDNKPVYTTLENTDTERGKDLLKLLSTQRRARNEGGISEEEATILLEEEIKELKALRTKLLNTKQKYYLEIKSQEFGPKRIEKNGKDRVRGKAIGRISNDINNLTLEVGKSSTSKYAKLSNGTNVWSGKLYVIDAETGRTYDLQPRTLNSSEVDLATKLLQTVVNKEGKLKILGKNNPISILRDLIYLDAENPNEEYRIGLNKNKELVIGNDTYRTITPEILELLKTKLANKYLQFNARIPQDNPYTEYKIDSTGKIFIKEWNSYKEYLLDNEDIPFGTDVVKIEEGQAKYTNPYLTFNSNPRLMKDVIKKEELIETPFGEYETQLEEGVIIPAKPKRVKKGEKIDRETLNRLALDKISKLISKEEKEWFKEATGLDYEEVQGLIEGKALGQVTNAGKVLLSTEATTGTLQHEAFHIITQFILSDKQVDDIYKEAREKFREKSKNPFPNSIYKKIVYHGSNNPNIISFDSSLIGSKNKGAGFNFTENIEDAKNYGKYIYEVKLNISNWVTTDKEAKENNLSGINDIDEIVVYNPEQIYIINKSDLEIEEILAEDFVNYTTTGKVLNERPKRNTIFRKILNFLKKLIGLDNITIEEVYNRLYTSKYKTAKRLGTKRLLSKPLSRTKVLRGDYEFDKQVIDGISALFTNKLIEQGFSPNDLLRFKDLESKLLDQVYDELIEKEESKPLEDLTYILNNWEDVTKRFSKQLELYNVKLTPKTKVKDLPENKDDESTPINKEEEDALNKGERSGSGYNESANQTATKDTMSGTSKWLIYSLPQLDKQGNQEYNELELPQLVDFNKTYNFLLNHLSGIVGFDNKYNAIVKLGLTNPIYKELANRLKDPNDILTYEQLMLQMQFNQDFNKNKFESYITVVDGDVIKTFSANSSNLQDKIKTKWQSNLRGASKYIVEKDGKFVISNDITKDKLSPINFLKALGITFSEPTLKYFKDNKYQIPELNDAVNYVTQEIEKTYIDENLTNGVVNLYSGSSKGRVDALLELEAQFTDETIELSFSSVEGKTIYQISLHNFLSLISSAINNSKTRDELFSKMPHLNTINTQHSLYLDTLFTKDGKKRVIAGKPIEINVDLLDGLKDSGEGLQSTKLSTGDKIVQDLNVLLTTGKTPYLRAADKSTEHAISLSQFTSTTTNKNVLAVPLESLTKGFESSTINKIFKGYFIDEIKSMRALIIDELGNNVAEYRTKGKEFRIFSGILSQETKNEINNSNLLKVDNNSTPVILESDVDRVISTLIDSVIQDVYSFLEDYNKENIKLFKEYKVENKVSKTLLDRNNKETLYRAFTVNDFINSIEQTKLFTGDLGFYKDFYKRTSAFTGTKKYADNSTSTNKQLNSIIKRSDNKLANGIINVTVFEDSKQKSNYIQEYTNVLLATGISEDKAREILSAYDSMDEGDAQGWITLDEFREFLMRVGDFKPQQNKIFDKAIKGETLNPEEIYYFQTLKAQYSGPQIYNGLFVPTFHKFSLMPLIPSMIKGTNLEKLNNTMKEQKIGYALFKTGSKVGTLVNNEGKANPFYSNYTHGDVTSKIGNIQKVSYDYLGIQLDINPIPKTEVIYGTQFRKLVLSNLVEHGTIVNDRFKNIINEYNKVIEILTERAKKSLTEELGFLHKDNYTDRDITKLVQTLQKATEDRALPDNLIDAIQTQVIDGKVMLKYPLDALVTKSKVESMLMSLINSNIIRQKVAGDAMIQGASSGFEKLGNRVEGSNDLKFYRKDKDGKTLPMEVKVPLTNHYKGLLEHYGTIDNINKAIKEGTIDKRLIEMVGYRIPTQGLNSIEYMTIKEFLPTEASNLIILPTEIVAKSGGDYDIDKLNVIRPSFMFNPETKEIAYNEVKQIATDKNNVLVNRLIELTKDIVSDESNFVPLITPNSVSNTKRLVQEIRELRGESKEPKVSNTTQLLKYGYKLDQFTFFLSGKAGVGIAAVQNTHHILSQLGGLYIDKKFAENVFIESKKDDKGNLLLGNIENLKGDKISDLISEFINAYVDIAKDPFVFSLNATTKAAGVWFYLTRIGADFDTIAYFMNQPIITEYLKAESINDSLSVKNSPNYLYKQQLKEEVERKYTNNLKKLKGEFLTSKDYKTYSTKDNDTLREYIKDKPNTVEFNQAQLQFLDNYLTYQKHARMLSNAANAVNSDTAGVGKDLDASQDKLNQFIEVDIEGFIPNWKNAMKDSFVKAFNQHEYSLEVYKELQITQEENINKTIRNITGGIQTFKSSDKDKINSLVRNDFISYLLQNYTLDEGQLLKEYRDILFKGDNSLAKRLIKLQQKPKLELTESEKLITENKFIKELFPLLNQGIERTDNIKMFTKRLDTFTSNLFTQEFRKLEELSPNTYRNLIRLGILQSGLNNSPITYLGLIPYDTYGDMVNNALDNYDKKNGIENLYKFRQLFYRNNYKGILPAFKNNYTKYTGSQWEIGSNLGNYMFGKDYSLDKFIINNIDKPNLKEVKLIESIEEDINIVEQEVDNEPSIKEDLQNLEKSINFNDKVKPWINSLESNVFGIENTEQLIQELKEAKNEEDLAKVIKKICG